MPAPYPASVVGPSARCFSDDLGTPPPPWEAAAGSVAVHEAPLVHFQGVRDGRLVRPSSFPITMVRSDLVLWPSNNSAANRPCAETGAWLRGHLRSWQVEQVKRDPAAP